MSEIRATTISDLVGTGPVTLTGQSAAKAWSNLNGTGTIAERDSFNVSGYVDNGTGDYTFTISNDMSDANYSQVMGAYFNSGVADIAMRRNSLRASTASQVNIKSQHIATGAIDSAFVEASVFGDLA